MTRWESDDGMVTLYLADCLDVLPELSDIAACVCDPPYGLGFMGKEWDTPGALVQRPDAKGQTWDKVGGNHNPTSAADRTRTRRSEGARFYIKALEWFEAILGTLLPGAPILAFGGTRTWHRLASAIEDAGAELRDTLMWLYGQGFPKSFDISKAIDDAAGAEREVVAEHPSPASTNRVGTMGRPEHSGSGWNETAVITAPKTDEAKLWNGWGTALKPGWEPILLAMKAIEGTFAQNALEHGVAGLNIDGARIHSGPSHGGSKSGETALGQGSGWNSHENKETVIDRSMANGRWPANAVMTHHPDCECVGTKRVKNPSGHISSKAPSEKTSGIYGEFSGRKDFPKHGEDGFETVEDWRCHHECPVRLLDEQSGTLRARGNLGESQCGSRGYGGFAPHMNNFGAGDSGGASRFFYCAKASTLERTANRTIKNTHPTVKPIDLMRWLVRLVSSPTKGVIIDPFMGSGTTGVAAVLEGVPFIGIEREAESFWIAVERIKRVGALPREDAPENPNKPEQPEGQMELF